MGEFADRLDATCRNTLDVDLADVGRVEHILVQALELQECPEQPPSSPACRFARPGGVFAHGKTYNSVSTDSTEGGQS